MKTGTLPNRMDPILQFRGIGALNAKEPLYNFPVASFAGFKALSVVKGQVRVFVRSVCSFHVGSPGTIMRNVDVLIRSVSVTTEQQSKWQALNTLSSLC